MTHLSALCFKATVDPSLVCFVPCMQLISQIHLWCDTCWPSTQKILFDPRTCTHILFWSTPLKCSTDSSFRATLLHASSSLHNGLTFLIVRYLLTSWRPLVMIGTRGATLLIGIFIFLIFFTNFFPPQHFAGLCVKRNFLRGHNFLFHMANERERPKRSALYFIRRATILLLLCFCSIGCCTWGCSCQ